MAFIRCIKCNEIVPPEKADKYSQTCLKCADKSFSYFWLIAVLGFVLTAYYFDIVISLIVFAPIFIFLHKRYPLKLAASTSIQNKNTAPYPYEWARNILNGQMGDCIILDCETTGLQDNDEIIQLAIIDTHGNTLFNSLVKPSPRKRISEKAQKIHGITRDILKNAPNFPDIAKEVFEIIKDKTVITYNAEFDRRMLIQTIQKYPELNTAITRKFVPPFQCAMKAYSAHVAEWSPYHNAYKWQKLPGGDHSAIGDCRATLKIIELLATKS